MAETVTAKALDIELHDRVPDGQWEIVDVKFPATPHTDYQIPHSLSPASPEQIEFTVLRQASAGAIYEDQSPSRTKWQPGFIVLRSNQGGWTGRLMLRVLKSPRLYNPSAITAASPIVYTSLAVASGSPFYLDGGGDTFIWESAANQMSFVVGGSTRFRLDGGAALAYIFAYDLSISSGYKLYIDGGGDTYFVEESANQVLMNVGGTRNMTATAGVTIFGTTSTAAMTGYGAVLVLSQNQNSAVGLGVTNQNSGSSAWAGLMIGAYGNSWYIAEGSSANNGNALEFRTDVTSPVTRLRLTTAGYLVVNTQCRLYLDGGSNTWIEESAGDQVDVICGGNTRFRVGANGCTVWGGYGLTLPATGPLYLDGGSNTYIIEDSADRISFIVGGSTRFRIDYTGTWAAFYSHVILSAGYYVYFDGGGDTFIYESAANQLALVAGGAAALVCTASYVVAAGGFAMTTWPTTASASNTNVTDGNSVARSTSARRFKRLINPLSLASVKDTVMALQPVTYKSLCEMDDPTLTIVGFVAEEVEAIDPRLVSYDADGQPNYVNYDRIPAFIIPVVQDHERRIALLETKVG